MNPNGTITYTPVAGLQRPRRLYVCDQRRPGRHGELARSSWSVAGFRTWRRLVKAGPDQALTFPAATATLSGTASDDGPPGAGLTTLWTKVSGPGTVTFGAAAALTTSATFSVLGVYVLRLTANDGAMSTSDTLTITDRFESAEQGD